MPRILEYEQALEGMQTEGLRSLYYNSGAFGFAKDVATESLGWIGPEDSSLRQQALALVRRVKQPFEQELARLLGRAIEELLPGIAWLMPKSHWAYELDFGSSQWMSALLESIGIDPNLLRPRTNASAIEFEPGEMDLLCRAVEELLSRLSGSDFALGFPGRPVVCTLHHHKQIWWTSTDRQLIRSLRQLAE